MNLRQRLAGCVQGFRIGQAVTRPVVTGGHQHVQMEMPAHLVDGRRARTGLGQQQEQFLDELGRHLGLSGEQVAVLDVDAPHGPAGGQVDLQGTMFDAVDQCIRQPVEQACTCMRLVTQQAGHGFVQGIDGRHHVFTANQRRQCTLEITRRVLGTLLAVGGVGELRTHGSRQRAVQIDVEQHGRVGLQHLAHPDQIAVIRIQHQRRHHHAAGLHVLQIFDHGAQHLLERGDVLRIRMYGTGLEGHHHLLGLVGQHGHARQVGHLQRPVRLVQMQACTLDGVLAVRAGQQLIQCLRNMLQRFPDLWHRPGQGHHVNVVAVFHPVTLFQSNCAPPAHPERRWSRISQPTRKRATEFLSSRASSESCRIEPAVCCVPSLVWLLTSRMRWMLCATDEAEAAWFSVVREMRMIRSASSCDT